MNKRHSLGYTVGKKNKMEGLYFLVQIRSKFGNKYGLVCSSKWRTPNFSTGKSCQDGLPNGGQALKTFSCSRVLLV